MTPIRKTVRKLMMAITNLETTYSFGTSKTVHKTPAFWLLYALDDGEKYSQKKLRELWGFNRTTLNSNIKKCEAAEYLQLKPIPGERREMQISLTESGNAYAKQLLEAVYRAEDRAMEETISKYSEDFVSALDFYCECLKRSFKEELDPDCLTSDMEGSNA